MITLRADLVFDGVAMIRDGAVGIDGGLIADAGGTVETLPPGTILCPGFIDLQVNGAGGVLFNAETTADALTRMGAALARVGTTSFLPTLISSRAQFDAAERAVATVLAGPDCGVVGLHIEGPFINPARHGTHPLDMIVVATEADAVRLGTRPAWPRIVTVAPEMVEPELLARLIAGNTGVFVAHSDATGAQAAAGFAAGVVGTTHLFNAMSQLAGRAPGLVGATLGTPGTVAGIIVDGIHVAPVSVRVAHAAMGPARLFLVSDCMPTAASDTTSFRFKGETIELRDGRLVDADGSLAGAHLTMAQAVKCAVDVCGLPLADALRMATATPARIIGLADRGRIATGLRADLVALDPDLNVIGVWRAGVKIH